MLFVASVMLYLPAARNFLFQTAAAILGRPLRNTLYWGDRIIKVAVHLFFTSIVCACFYLTTIGKYQLCYNKCQLVYNKNKKRNDIIVCVSIVIFFFLLFMLPFVIFGENSVITIHDNLEDSVPRFHYIYKNNLFWTFDKELPVMNGISTLFFNREGFTLYNAIYCLLPTYTGYLLNHILCVILGFLSMFFFQKIIFRDENIIILTLTSLAYSLLPVICVYKMGVAVMPFAGIVFYKLLTSNSKKWFLFAFLYPFTSEFSAIGIFVCATWLVATIILYIKQYNQYKINGSIAKTLHIRNLILGLLLICLGVCITDCRLIYARLVLREPLNRDFFNVPPHFLPVEFIRYFLFGTYHAATLQFYLIDWAVLITFIFIWKKHKEQYYLKSVLTNCLIICFICACIAALSEAKILGKIISIIIPPIQGLSLTRIYIIARLSWYVAFTASLLYIAKKKVKMAYAFAVLQIILIFFSCDAYNDSENSWWHNLYGSYDITWKEFYSEEQFNHIKENINYAGENVCAVGYHPGILLYNDFNTIDGYLSVFPYKQQLLWHDLMLPEFERDEVSREYFDSWGGRRYIYNHDLPYGATLTKLWKYHAGVNLHINMNMLKDVYKCKYILSRAKLLNAEQIGLKHRGTFDRPESIYIIWVYEVL